MHFKFYGTLFGFQFNKNYFSKINTSINVRQINWYYSIFKITPPNSLTYPKHPTAELKRR